MPVGQKKYPQLPGKVFKSHAKTVSSDQRFESDDGKIWVAWNLFLRKGGFAYIAASNDSESKEALTIELDEE